MANSQNNGKPYVAYATVDTAPTSAGYWTAVVNKRAKNSKVGRVGQLFFSRRGTGVMTITLQFKCYGDTAWQDYNPTTAPVNGDRWLVESGASSVQWRAGVKEDDYSSGSCTFGFDW